MNKVRYSPLYKSAAEAIGSNGFKILQMPRYAHQIKKPMFHTLSGGFASVKYLDADGAIIAENSCGLREWYPVIGEVVELGN